MVRCRFLNQTVPVIDSGRASKKKLISQPKSVFPARSFVTSHHPKAKSSRGKPQNCSENAYSKARCCSQTPRGSARELSRDFQRPRSSPRTCEGPFRSLLRTFQSSIQSLPGPPRRPPEPFPQTGRAWVVPECSQGPPKGPPRASQTPFRPPSQNLSLPGLLAPFRGVPEPFQDFRTFPPETFRSRTGPFSKTSQWRLPQPSQTSQNFPDTRSLR